MVPKDRVLNWYLVEALSREPLQAIIGDDFILFQQQESHNHCYNSGVEVDSEDNVVEFNEVVGTSKSVDEKGVRHSEIGIGTGQDDDGPMLNDDRPILNANGLAEVDNKPVSNDNG